MNYRKYKIRRCYTRHHCNLCNTPIFLNEKYYDGGYGRRVHLACNDVEGAIRFVRWMRGRGGGYAELRINHYLDGEIYFSSMGAELSLSQFLKRNLDGFEDCKPIDNRPKKDCKQGGEGR